MDLFWHITVGMAILAGIRSTLLLAFRYLPLLLISFIGFIGLGLGNTALLVLFLGHATIVPLITMGLHALTVGMLKYSPLTINDVSQLVPIMPSTGVAFTDPTGASGAPSYWMAHISFFFGYLICNAFKILLTETDLSTIKSQASLDSLNEKIMARKQKGGVLIGTLFFFYILLCVIRYYATGAEQFFLGIVFSTIFLGGAGVGWYFFAEQCGATNSDIFGIAMQMMSPESAQDKPKACVYTGTP